MSRPQSMAEPAVGGTGVAADGWVGEDASRRISPGPTRTQKALKRALPELADGLRYTARQPILDTQGRVHGYELLFRSGPEQVFRGDGDLATRTMLDNTVIFGMERLTGGLPAFVNCTVEALTEQLVEVLPSGMTILEILETIEPTPELVEACRALKSAGFRLALDDFVWAPKFEPLLALADYVKVDFNQSPAAERKALLEHLRGHTVALIAEKIETQEQFREARAEGFALFQGFYFCRPELLENHKIPANHLSYLEILQVLRSDSIDLRKLARLVRRDAALTYRLLRLVNSPLSAQRQEVRSVQAALLAVGEDSFRRIATLAIASELNGGRPSEVLRMALVRARFCELAAESCGLNPTEQYLLGLVSLLPAMMRRPMEELAPALALRKEVCQALVGVANPEGALLGWMENQERGDWAGCDACVEANHLDAQQLVQAYAAAVLWAEDTLHFAV